MSGSRYQSSVLDGLPARVSGAWAQEKLAYLDKYSSIFNVGMKKKWQRIYLDLLAGTGRCIREDTGEEFDGSPLVALSCVEPFTELVFVEEEPALASALRERTKDRGGSVLEANCNEGAAIERMRQSLGHGRLGLAFIDNLGLDVTLATISQLTDGRKVDLFIVFQIGDLKRNVGDVLAGKDSPARFDAFFGAGWDDVARKAVRRNASAEEITEALLDFYSEQLNRLGYSHIAHSRRVMRNSRNVGLYRLILAGKHPRAKEFFEKVSEIDPLGQRSLL